MSYEDLEKAKAERAAKNTAEEATKAVKAVKKALREANNVEKEAKRAADKRKRPAAVDAPEPKVMVPRGSEAL
ncbi:hypothetical protein CC78DRAFT_588160 [Lojkania enalia]|uniref:Uncharacterized protein n=1 Tax=Lojkania enalia TaxID=147567 RepID=A0A9P4JW23_9PLEO|nr:hypothetical protein CC78DRAFT_588160 [Didymosphaeria enalia]